MNLRFSSGSGVTQNLDTVYVDGNKILIGEGTGTGKVIVSDNVSRVFWGENDYTEGDGLDDFIGDGRIVGTDELTPPQATNGVYYTEWNAHNFVLYADNVDQTTRQPIYINTGGAGGDTHFIAPRDGWIKNISVYLNDQITAGDFKVRLQYDQSVTEELTLITCDTSSTQIGSTGNYYEIQEYTAWQKPFSKNDALAFIAYENTNTLAPLTIDIQVVVEVMY